MCNEPETLWCESCGEVPQEVRSAHAGLCGDCYGASISEAVREMTGDHICGHPLYHGGKVFAICCLPHGQEHDHGTLSYT